MAKTDLPVTEGATVKDLEPAQPLAISFRQQKNSLRYQGSHQLNLRRPSRFPAASRRYIHGDPTRLIDWRAFARTDQLLIREKREEASGRIVACFDLSESMAWPSQDSRALLPEAVPSKFELAVRIALNLAYTHLKQGDSFKLLVWREEQAEPDLELYVPSAMDAARLYHRIEDSGFSPEAITAAARPYDFSGRGLDLFYWLSDGLSDHAPSWVLDQARLARLVHVLTSLEAQIDWVNNEYCYYDFQRQKKEYLGSVLKQQQAYATRFADWQKSLAETFTKRGSGYQLVTDKTTIMQYQRELCLYPDD